MSSAPILERGFAANRGFQCAEFLGRNRAEGHDRHLHGDRSIPLVRYQGRHPPLFRLVPHALLPAGSARGANADRDDVVHLRQHRDHKRDRPADGALRDGKGIQSKTRGIVIGKLAQKSRITILLEYGLARLFAALVLCLPYKVARNFGSGIGTLAHRFLSRRRALTQRNLAFVFPEIEPVEIRQLSKAAFQNIGKTLTESIYSAKWTKEQLLAHAEVQGWEHLESALARGRGVLLISAHLGNWEVMSMTLSARGCKLTVVARRMDNPRLDPMVNRMRSHFGTVVIAGENSLKEMIRCLRRNEALGILMDLNQYQNGVFADFFHKPAATTPIAPLLARKTGAVILPVHISRLNDGRHRVTIKEELEPADIEDTRQFLAVNTRLCNKAIETVILENRSQWFWIHDRWKTRPPNESLPAEQEA